jgi:hypothetical protein
MGYLSLSSFQKRRRITERISLISSMKGKMSLFLKMGGHGPGKIVEPQIIRIGSLKERYGTAMDTMILRIPSVL